MNSANKLPRLPGRVGAVGARGIAVLRGAVVQGNWPLLVGLAGVAGLLVLVLFGPWLAPADPLAVRLGMQVGGRVIRAPFPPSPEFPLGSDTFGRDILSGLLAGARYTLLFMALTILLGFLAALPLGLWAGWRRGGLAQLIRSLAVGASALPVLFLAGFILLWVHRHIWAWSQLRQALASALLLSLFAIPRLAHMVERQTVRILAEPYVEAAVSAGASRARILWRHVLPNIFAPLATVALLEAASVLRVLALLGLFQIYVAPTKSLQIAEQSTLVVPAVPDWTSYTGYPSANLRSAHWILLYPGLAIAATVLTLHLMAEGLARHWRR